MQRRLAAILAADVVGFSGMMERDEGGTFAALVERRRTILEPLVAEHRGRIFKVLGDGVLVEFSSAVNAVSCAVALQERMAAANTGLPEDRRIVLRIGVHAGDVIVEGGDLYGDGVNIAARLQALIEPGGIGVSGTLHEQVANKLPFAFEVLGSRQLKNIAKPITLLRVCSQEQAAIAAEAAGAVASIAVLPFVNLSGVAEHEYISDGMTESIITDLSRFRDLFVVARNSSFSYKGKAAKVQDVCRELGVRYLLEGSMQRSGDRLRITAQLIDGASGQHLWAERYHRRFEDLFEVMDEVTQTIVATLATTYGGRLRKALREGIAGSGTRDFQALEPFLRGMETLNLFTKECIASAVEHFEKAAAQDPKFAKAHAKVAWSHLVAVYLGYSSDPALSLDKALEAANRAVRSDDDEAWGHWALAGHALFHGEHERCLIECQKAIELNPNDADVLADVGWFYGYLGRAKEGLGHIQKAMRVNPHHPTYYKAQIGQTYFDAREYEKAIETLEGLRGLDTIAIQLYLAASHTALGHGDAARAAAARVLELEPAATVAKCIAMDRSPYRSAEDRAHLGDNLRKAGLAD